MFLAIDCGNTNIVFGLYKNPQESAVVCWRCRTSGGMTADEYAAFLAPLLAKEEAGFDDIESVLVASVVPDVNLNLQRFCDAYLQVTPDFIRPDGTNVPITIDLPEPVKVGADQLVNAVAAKARYGYPCAVIDFGTATTFDIVNGDGAFTGGIIAPGVNLSVTALHQAAALLPKIGIVRPERVIGRNTVEAMQSGLYWGYVSMIEGMIRRVRAEISTDMPFIATGGLSPFFSESIADIAVADPYLTLEGLRLIHAGHTAQKAVMSAA